MIKLSSVPGLYFVLGQSSFINCLLQHNVGVDSGLQVRHCSLKCSSCKCQNGTTVHKWVKAAKTQMPIACEKLSAVFIDFILSWVLTRLQTGSATGILYVHITVLSLTRTEVSKGIS